MKIILGLLLLTAGLPACSPRLALPTGNYRETGDPGVALSSSKQLRLLPNQRFEYFEHSDMVGHGKYGAGTYQWRGRRLRLVCDGQLLGRDAAWAEARPLPGPPAADSLTLSFRVWSTLGRNAPIPYTGATVVGRDASGRDVTGVFCDPAGRAVLRVARRAPPAELLVSGGGSLPWRESWPGAATAYEVYLPAQLVARYAAGTVRQFSILTQTADQLVLRDGVATVVLKREELVGRAK